MAAWEEGSNRLSVAVVGTSGLPTLTPTAVYLGTYNPDYQASLGTNLNYKGFSLGLLFDTKQGGKFFSRTKDILAFVGTSAETAGGDRDGYIFPNSVYLDAASGKYIENTTVNFLHPVAASRVTPATTAINLFLYVAFIIVSFICSVSMSSGSGCALFTTHHSPLEG